MRFCHLEDCPPWVPVDSSLGLGHQEEDTGCAGGLVRRPFRRCPGGSCPGEWRRCDANRGGEKAGTLESDKNGKTRASKCSTLRRQKDVRQTWTRKEDARRVENAKNEKTSCKGVWRVESGPAGEVTDSDVIRLTSDEES